MATSQTTLSKGQKGTDQGNGKDEAKHNGERVIEKLEREVKEVPEVGQLWIEREWMDDQLKITHRRFVAAFTGKAYELLHLDTGIGKAEAATGCLHRTLLTHHKLNGKPVTFMWIDIQREYLHPEEIEITLKVPKKMIPVILGRNKDGYSLWGKIQTDMMALYEKKGLNAIQKGDTE